MTDDESYRSVPGHVREGGDVVKDSWEFSFSDAVSHLLGGNQIDRKLVLYGEAMDTVADWYDADQVECTVELDGVTGSYEADSLDEMRSVVFDGGHVDSLELSYRDEDGGWFALEYDRSDGEVGFVADEDLPYLDRLHQDLDVL